MLSPYRHCVSLESLNLSQMDRNDVLAKILNLAEPVGPRVPASAVWTILVPYQDRTAAHDHSVTL